LHVLSKKAIWHQSTLAGRLGRIAFASSGRTFRDSLPKSTEPGRPQKRDRSNVHTETKRTSL
jgi:hypothetical protein